MNILQKAFILRVCKYGLLFWLVWNLYWALIWEGVVWQKPFILFRDLDKWVQISLSLLVLPLIDVLLADPQLLASLKLPKLSLRRQKKKERKTKRQRQKSSKTDKKPIY